MLGATHLCSWTGPGSVRLDEADMEEVEETHVVIIHRCTTLGQTLGGGADR